MSWLMTNAANVAALYGLPPSLLSVDGVDCLTTDSGWAAVRYSLGGLLELSWAGASLDRLAELGLRDFGQFIRTQDGAYAVEVDGRWVYLTQYMPGTACDASNFFEVRAVGRLIAHLHRASPAVLAVQPPPTTCLASDWLTAARERAAYWRLATHRYRKGTRGEALRELLRQAEEALTRAERYTESLAGERVLSLAHASFGQFAYMRETHAVCLNEAHLCVDHSFINVGELLFEAGLGNEPGLHFLSAYQAARPLSALEREMLLAYLCYPHEWAEKLDEVTRGNATFDGERVLALSKRKGEWLDWLEEHLTEIRRDKVQVVTPKNDVELVTVEADASPELSPPPPSPPSLTTPLTWRPFPRR